MFRALFLGAGVFVLLVLVTFSARGRDLPLLGKPNGCAISAVTVGSVSCNGNGTFNVSVTVVFTGAPSTGVLEVSVDGVLWASVSAPFVSPAVIPLSNVKASVLAHSIKADFSADAACAMLVSLNSPAGCVIDAGCNSSVGCWGSNILVNSDFSLGNTGFTTSMAYNGPCIPGSNGCSSNVATPPPATNDIICKGAYGIGVTAPPCNKFWSKNVRDHTTGTGNFLMLDFPAVYNSAQDKIWCQNVVLTPATDYCYGGYFLNLVPAGTGFPLPQFALSVGGTQIGANFTAVEDEKWHFQGFEFNSGAGGTVQMCIENRNGGTNGLDIAMDDLSLRPHTLGTPPVTATDSKVLCGTLQDVTVNVTANDAAGVGSLDITTLTVVEAPAFSVGIITGVNTVTGAITFHPDPTNWGNGSVNHTSFKYRICNTVGCCMIDSVLIRYYQSVPIPSAATAANVLCFGGSSGSIFLSTNSGQAPYSYIWTGGAVSVPTSTNTAVANGLLAGSYAVTVTDAHGCTGTSSAIVAQPVALGVSATANGATCSTSATGSIVTNASGGVSPYSFAWSDGQTVGTATGLTSGTYTVTVTDANGCTKTATAAVLATVAPNLTVAGLANVACFGGATGSININAAGGQLPYAYMWSGGGIGNTPSAGNLVSGTYTVTVTDGNGCTATVSAAVVQPAALVAAIATNTGGNNVCAGASASLSAVTTGGVLPIGYVWSSGSTVASVTPTLSGTTAYSVTTTDAHGCTASALYTVGVFAVGALSIDGQADICAGGVTTLHASGGFAGYGWSSGSVAESISVSAGGTYFATATDAHGCTATASLVVTVHSAPLVSAGRDTTVFGGQAVLAAMGGVVYMWSPALGVTNANAAATTTNITSTTVFTVTATDAHGCTGSSSVLVRVQDYPDCVGITEGFTPNGDGVNDTWAIGCLEFFVADVEVYNRWGQLLYAKKNYANDWDGRYNGSPLPDGTYYFIIQLLDPQTGVLHFRQRGSVTVLR